MYFHVLPALAKIINQMYIIFKQDETRYKSKTCDLNFTKNTKNSVLLLSSKTLTHVFPAPLARDKLSQQI